MDRLHAFFACCTSRTTATEAVAAAPPGEGDHYPACSLEALGCLPNYNSPYLPRTAFTVREARLWGTQPGEKASSAGGAPGDPLAVRAARSLNLEGAGGELQVHTRGDFWPLSHRDRDTSAGGSMSHREGPASLEGAFDEAHRAHFSRAARSLREGSFDSFDSGGGRGRDLGGFLRERAGERPGAFVSPAPRGLFDPLGIPTRGGGQRGGGDASSKSSPLSDADTQVPREKSPTLSLFSDETLSTRSHESVCSIASSEQWEEGMARPRYAEAHMAGKAHRKKMVYA